MKFGTGHIEDTFDPRDWDADHLVGTVLERPNLDLRDTDPPIWHQGNLGTCVMQSLLGAIWNRAKRVGIVLPQPSVLGGYAPARWRDDGKLVDLGCRPRTAVETLRKQGIVPEYRWPYDESKVNVMPPWDVFQHGADAVVAGFFRIYGHGEDRLKLVRKALTAGYPVSFAQPVEQQFEDYSGGILGEHQLPFLGGHMTTVVGYDASTDAYLCRNSWGVDWGIGGYYWASAARLGSQFCTDFYVVTLLGDRPVLS
jgi:hypothetical protein